MKGGVGVAGYGLVPGVLTLQLKGHGDEVTCVDWDKSKLYSGSKDQHVIEWNVDTGVYTK